MIHPRLLNIFNVLILLLIVSILAATVYLERAEVKKAYEAVPDEAVQPQEEEIKDVYWKLKRNNDINILVLGDSIAQSDGASGEDEKWYNKLADEIGGRYNVACNVYMAAESGSTAFAGILDKVYNNPEVWDRGYDLIFLCYGYNDSITFTPENFSPIYESMVNAVVSSNRNAEVITLIENPIKNAEFPDAIKRISNYYDCTYIDMIEAFKNSGIAYEKLTNDGIHPNDAGYDLYYKKIIELLSRNSKNGKKVKHEEKPLMNPSAEKYNKLYVNGNFSGIKGFKQVKTADGKDIYSGADRTGYLETSFNGSIAGISFLTDRSGGMARVYIDGKLVSDIDCYSPVPGERKILLDGNLELKEHKIRIEATGNRNTGSNGTNVYISGIITNS